MILDDSIHSKVILIQRVSSPLDFSDLCLLVLGKDVEAERLLPVVDEVDGLVGALDGEEGEDGAEDLLLHDGIRRVDVA